MNLYRTGVSAGGAIVVPEALQPYVEAYTTQLGLVRGGAADILRGGGRFYLRGTGGDTVGVGGTGLFDALVDVTMDVAHIFLLLVGMFALWSGVRG